MKQITHWGWSKLLLLLILLILSIGMSLFAEEVSDITLSYAEYLKKYSTAIHNVNEIYISGTSYSNTNIENIILYEKDRVVTPENGFLEWQIEVLTEGFYNIEVEYYPLPGRGGLIERALLVNGKLPFLGAGRLVFQRIWGNDGPVYEDALGNEIRTKQVEKPVLRKVVLNDPLFYEKEPYNFFFRKGLNTLRLEGISESMAIKSIRFFMAPEIKKYSEILKDYKEKDYPVIKNGSIKIQGEHSIRQSNASLFPIFDPGDPLVEPYHPAFIRMNSIGGFRWQNPGEWISYQVQVPETGLYTLAIKGKQDERRGTYSNRRLLIDGEVPFQEVDAIIFPFSNRYTMTMPENEETGEPYLFYLEKGLHEITLQVVYGSLVDIVQECESILYDMNSLYRAIIMITSTNPDPLRTYELEERIPFLLEDIDSLGIRIENVIDTFESITGEKGEFNSILSNVAILLRKMVSRPQSIPGNLANFRDGVGSIGTWLTNVKKQPLQIDYLLLAGVDDILPKTKPNFFQALLHEIRAFISSFTVDQNNLSKTIDESEKNKEDDLHIWLGLGRDQAQLLRQMLDDSFNPETNIAVNLELVENMGGLLIPSILAKTNPDVALGAANMDLAFRGALYDISQFPDFEDVITRFSNSALTGFTFQDQVFALPEVQSFPMLFYRKDILNELGFSIPQTWDDIYKILPILQERNMNFGLLPNMYNYMIFLYQRRVPLYKEDNIAVNLSSEQAIAAFQEMTDLFLLYDLPIEFNLVNRFRMGEMPLVIADYNQYNILSVFAPELNGKWGIAPVPGIRETDGTINRTVPVTQSMLIGTTIPAGTTGSVIFSNSDNKNEAWDFLKWWTRKDTQARFGFEMEALIGSAARWATANKEALKMLPWRPEERMNLEAQWEWVEGIPPLLGGYYVPRHFDWLFRDVVLTYMPLRDSVLDYTDKINHEITRKRDEFNLITNYDELTDELKDLYWKTYTHVNVLDWQLDEAGERRYVDGD